MNKNSYHQLQRLVRGFSNHRRIEILDLLKRKPELSVLGIAEELDVSFKTISGHIRRLENAGLIIKWEEGASVRHRMTDRGERVLKFLESLGI